MKENRSKAVVSLRGKKHPQAIEVIRKLTEEISNTRSFYLKSEIASALTGIKSSWAINKLEELAKSSFDSARVNVAKALKKNESNKASQILFLLSKDESKEVRLAVANSLKLKNSTMKIFERLIKDKDMFVREATAISLAGSKNTKAYDIFKVLLDDNFIVSSAAARSLSEDNSSLALALKEELTYSESLTQKKLAGISLLGCQKSKCFDLISYLISFETYDYGVQVSGWRALQGSKSSGAKDLILKANSDSFLSSKLKQEIAGILANYTDSEVIRLLKQYILDEKLEVRVKAIESLSNKLN